MQTLFEETCRPNLIQNIILFGLNYSLVGVEVPFKSKRCLRPALDYRKHYKLKGASRSRYYR